MSNESTASGGRPRREIRSFARREGRITAGQIKALQQEWPNFGLELSTGLCAETFAVQQPTTLEIGFGMGTSLFEMATSKAGTNFVGIEVHRPGVGHLLQLASRSGLKNLKIYQDDAIDVLNKCIPCGFLDSIQILFPDPWHKRKHHKRRLINANFVKLLASRLTSSGIVHIATDWAPYATVIATLLSDWPRAPMPHRYITKYEKRGLGLDHEVFAFSCRKPA